VLESLLRGTDGMLLLDEPDNYLDVPGKRWLEQQLATTPKTVLLLDEPTDNLDLPSAEALQQGLESYQGTVLAVTHDRWFARSFDRFLIFTPDGDVREATEPAWD
jgi:ATPase subunit of ABC transporter with duplicated ATPase domains